MTNQRGDASAGPGPSDRIEATLVELRTLFHLLAGAHAPEFLEIGISMPQAKTLYLVVASGSLHMSELAARLGVTLSTVSGLVDRLVEAGLVERHEDPADRRQTFLTPTGRGSELVERFHELNVAHLRALLERLEEPDLTAVEHAFRLLARVAAEAAVPSSGPSQQQEHPAP